MVYVNYILIKTKIYSSESYFLLMSILFFKILFILFLDRGEGRKKERERNNNVCSPLMCPPTGGLAWNLGMCPRLGIELATLWIAVHHSTNELLEPGLGQLFFLIVIVIQLELSAFSLHPSTTPSQTHLPPPPPLSPLILSMCPL